MTSSFKILTDRTRVIQYHECPRRRWYGTFYPIKGRQIGIVPKKLNIPLATGTWTHHGLAMLLSGTDIEKAVNEAKKGYWQEIKDRGLQIEPGEDVAYVADEQCALVEGMLRAYAVSQLPALLEEFEVLEVEREECWQMDEWGSISAYPEIKQAGPVHELWFMSRLDALLLEKSSGDLYVQSYKTSGGWDSRKSKQNEHDMQGLSELASVENRLARWWTQLHAENSGNVEAFTWGKEINPKLAELLKHSPAPPKIQGIKMQFLMKGDRKEQPKGSGHRIQYSPLIRGYKKEGVASPEYAFTWQWINPETGKETKLYYGHWKPFNAWETEGGVKAWIELLASGTIQPEAGRDPLGDQFISPVPYFRQDRDVQSWMTSTKYQERLVWEHAQECIRAMESGDKEKFQTLLDQYFPMYNGRGACHYPYDCSYVEICHGVAVGDDPLGSGLYVARTPHHEDELKASAK